MSTNILWYNNKVTIPIWISTSYWVTLESQTHQYFSIMSDDKNKDKLSKKGSNRPKVCCAA